MTDSPESFTVCKGGIFPFLFIQISSLICCNKKCPEKLWITVDTRIAVYFIQTSIVRDTAGLQFPHIAAYLVD